MDIDRAHIEKSYHKLLKKFKNNQFFQLQPTKKQTQWEVKYVFINCQRYCPDCRKWEEDYSYDYCPECGFDYYYHVQKSTNEIQPIRRGRCRECYHSGYCGSLNSDFRCEACFYRSIGNKQLSDKIIQKRKNIQKELQTVALPEIQELKILNQKRGNLLAANMLFSGLVQICTQQVKQKLKASITPQLISWAKNPSIPENLSKQLKKKIQKKHINLYAKYNITY